MYRFVVQILISDPTLVSSVIVRFIIKLSSYWCGGSQWRRVPLCDWLDLGVKVKATANADVDFCSKMASLVAVMQTNRSSSVSSSKKRTGVMTQRRLRILDNNVLLFLSLASMLHCALADDKTLVLLDNLNIRDTHSIFFRSLAGQYEILTFSPINTLLFTVIEPFLLLTRRWQIISGLCRACRIELHAEHRGC